jgi:hypothetical protein
VLEIVTSVLKELTASIFRAEVCHIISAFHKLPEVLSQYLYRTKFNSRWKTGKNNVG